MYFSNNFKIHLVKESNLHMESTANQSKLVYSKIIWIIESILKRELSSLQDKKATLFNCDFFCN